MADERDNQEAAKLEGNWLDALKRAQPNEADGAKAKRLLQDLIHYGNRRSYEADDIDLIARALAVARTTPANLPEADNQEALAGEGVEEKPERFWLLVQEPGVVPRRCGSWPRTDLRKVMREFIEANPTAYIHVLTIDYLGEPWVEWGPEALQIADARSMSTGRRHNARVREAHAEAHGDLARTLPSNEALAGDDRNGVEGLVERLRASDRFVMDPISLKPRLRNPDGPEAADMIERLSRTPSSPQADVADGEDHNPDGFQHASPEVERVIGDAARKHLAALTKPAALPKEDAQ